MKKALLVLSLFLIFSVVVMADGEYEGNISIGTPQDPSINLNASTTGLSNGISCVYDNQCVSGRCDDDEMDGSNDQCMVVGKCLYNGTIYSDNANINCVDGNTYRKCSSGSVTNHDCESGQSCVEGVCIDSGEEEAKSDSGSTNPSDAASSGESCMFNSDCSSGYCVHRVCRPSSPYCGDGYCDGEENCVADDSGCEAGYVCSDGCQKSGSGRQLTIKSYEVDKKSVDELKTEFESLDNKTKDAIKHILGKNLENNLVSSICEKTQECRKNMTMERDLVAYSDKSEMRLFITYNGDKKIENLIIRDVVPKDFAESSDDITVIANAKNITVIEKDPVYLITFDTVYPDQKINISYSVNEIISESVVENAETPLIFAENLKEIICGDGICEGNEDISSCPQDCGKFKIDGLLIGGIAIIIIAGFIVIYMFFLKPKTSRPKRTSGKNILGGLENISESVLSKIKNKTKKKKKSKFVYKYDI